MKKIFKILCCISIVLAVVMSLNCVTAFAASNGIYIATATPHYKHPGTGIIEDSGGEGSAVLGQSMTESATYTKALVEVDSSGNTYVTVRLQLMDNIQNPKFKVDGKRNGSFSSVSASLMQEDYINNTADYRMNVPSENAVIRCDMYVIPMGRDVIFYITVSDLQSGSDDFVTSIKLEETTKKQTTVKTSTQSQTTANKSEEATEISETENTTALTTTAESTNVAVNSTESIANDTSKQNDDSAGLQEFDASGNEVGSEDLSKPENNDSNKVGWIVGGIVIVAAAGAAIWYFCFYKKKK
ncbi:MAG: hypothetical protein K2H13_07260 [Eubacterium sp.]|nr:hypothetical protein [Eubacterium sp.]MDE6767547.1 hypothetical protein [Eubacterium sp.]